MGGVPQFRICLADTRSWVQALVPSFFPLKKLKNTEAGEMAQQLREHVAFVEDPGPVSS